MKPLDGNDLIELGWVADPINKHGKEEIKYAVKGTIRLEHYRLHDGWINITLRYDVVDILIGVTLSVSTHGGGWGKEVNFRTKQDVITFMYLFKI